MRTIGTPTPGTVPDPAKTSLGIRRSTLGGPERAGLEEGVAKANGVPDAIPIARHSRGVTSSSVTTSVGYP